MTQERRCLWRPRSSHSHLQHCHKHLELTRQGRHTIMNFTSSRIVFHACKLRLFQPPLNLSSKLNREMQIKEHNGLSRCAENNGETCSLHLLNALLNDEFLCSVWKRAHRECRQRGGKMWKVIGRSVAQPAAPSYSQLLCTVVLNRTHGKATPEQSETLSSTEKSFSAIFKFKLSFSLSYFKSIHF